MVTGTSAPASGDRADRRSNFGTRALAAVRERATAATRPGWPKRLGRSVLSYGAANAAVVYLNSSAPTTLAQTVFGYAAANAGVAGARAAGRLFRNPDRMTSHLDGPHQDEYRRRADAKDFGTRFADSRYQRRGQERTSRGPERADVRTSRTSDGRGPSR